MSSSTAHLEPPYEPPPAALSQGELAERQYMSRPAPANLAYPAFPSLSLSSASSAHLTASLHVSFERGFYTTPAFGADLPPPFPQHDISAQDWAQFWAAMKRAADLSVGQRLLSNGVPLVAGLGLFGLPVTLLVEHGMKKKKVRDVVDVFADWNLRFFHPRRVDVYLMKGDSRVSGPLPPGSDTLPRDKEEAKARDKAPYMIIIAPLTSDIERY